MRIFCPAITVLCFLARVGPGRLDTTWLTTLTHSYVYVVSACCPYRCTPVRRTPRVCRAPRADPRGRACRTRRPDSGLVTGTGAPRPTRRSATFVLCRSRCGVVHPGAGGPRVPGPL